MADAKSRRDFMDYFKRKYEVRWGPRRPFLINRNVEKWAANDLIDSYGNEGCRKLVDRYFKVSERPEWKSFTYNAQKVYDAMLTEEADEKRRKTLNDQARKWIKENG